jgi:hypothetical protein
MNIDGSSFKSVINLILGNLLVKFICPFNNFVLLLGRFQNYFKNNK